MRTLALDAFLHQFWQLLFLGYFMYLPVGIHLPSTYDQSTYPACGRYPCVTILKRCLYFRSFIMRLYARPVRRFGCGGSKSALCCSDASICLFSSISVISPLVRYHPCNGYHAIPRTALFVMMLFLSTLALFLQWDVLHWAYTSFPGAPLLRRSFLR